MMEAPSNGSSDIRMTIREVAQRLGLKNPRARAIYRKHLAEKYRIMQAIKVTPVVPPMSNIRQRPDLVDEIDELLLPEKKRKQADIIMTTSAARIELKESMDRNSKARDSMSMFESEA